MEELTLETDKEPEFKRHKSDGAKIRTGDAEVQDGSHPQTDDVFSQFMVKIEAVKKVMTSMHEKQVELKKTLWDQFDESKKLSVLIRELELELNAEKNGVVKLEGELRELQAKKT